MSSTDRKRRARGAASTPSPSHRDDGEQSVKRTKVQVYTDKMIVDEDREVSTSTQWAQDFAHEIAEGNIVKVQLSNRMQLSNREGDGDSVSKHYCHKDDEVWAVDRGMLYEGKLERVEEYHYLEQYYVHFKHFKRCQDRWVDEELVAKKDDEEKIELLEEKGMDRVVMPPRKKK
ncbi:hypothetical protein B484DRAFT_434890 [Ochromonadaceae sp. CCMP2298]|nr:hypothetical protein B484DRAFT_434890 [Ochromonadaceae sp. CCMP2298]